MARRWLINTTTNRLAGVVDDDNAVVFPPGRAIVNELVIRASGAPRNTIRAGGLWVITNGVGVYTPPAAATTGQTRNQRRIILAREHPEELDPRGQRPAGDCRPLREPAARGPGGRSNAVHSRERQRGQPLRLRSWPRRK